MSWSLKGSYVETCSCELMCPCNLSFDHGATYDYCRVTLVFNIREGEIEGTDVGGLKAAVIADTPKVMTEGNWKLGMFIDEKATDEQADKLGAGLRRAARRPDGRARRRSSARCSASSARRSRSSTTGCATASASATRSTSRSRTSSRSGRDGRAGPVRRHVPPGRLGPHDGRGEALADQRLRHRVRGQDRASRRPSSPGPPERCDRHGAAERARPAAGLAPRVRRRARAARARRRCCSPSPASAGGGRSTRCEGMDDGPWTEPRDARLVPRRLGRDDGGDDVPVGRADGRALLAHDQERARRLAPLLFTGRLPADVGRRRSARVRGRDGRRPASAGDVLAWDRAGRWVAGATLVVAAVYELTPLKDVCLGKCRSPLGFLLGSWRDGRRGRAADGRAGTAPGASAAAGR